MMLGRIVHWLFPPLVSDLEEVMIGGKMFSIRSNSRYTIIKVDEVELFFIRETGTYDGYGQMEAEQSCEAVDSL